MNREEFEKIRDEKYKQLKKDVLEKFDHDFDKLTEEQNKLIREKFNALSEVAYQAGLEAGKKL